jgi:hypothetical protein
MKHLIFYILIAIFSLNYSLANSGEEINKNKINDYNELHFDISDLQNTNIEFIEITNDEFNCTLSVKVYIPTEAGIIGIGLSITASTCEEAEAGITDAIRGFIKGIF